MKNIITITVLLLALSMSYAQGSQDQFYKDLSTRTVVSDSKVEWVNFGPGMSGYNEEFWCHPTDTNVMFMGPDMHVSYGTWDNGKTWHTIKNCDGLGRQMERVHDIQFSLKNPDFGIATDRNGDVFESNDRGRTWDLVYSIPQNAKSRNTNAHTKVAVHPTNNDIWYVGAGDFWNVKANHRSLKHIRGKRSSRAAYGYVLKTTDHGKTWKKIANDISPDSLDVARIIISPIDPNNITIATNYGVFFSKDAGDSWKPGNKGLPNNLPRDITSYFDAKTGEYILYLVEQSYFTLKGNTVETKGGVFKSTNGGENWVNITGDLGFDYTKITDYMHRHQFHKAMTNWFGTDSKELITEYPTQTFPIFNRIVVNPTNKNEIYIQPNQRHDKSFGPGDTWKTEDGGLTWKICARVGTYWADGKDDAYWKSKGFETKPNVTFAHLQPYIDNKHEARQGNRILAINSVGEVFIGINQQTIRSNNGGKTWHQVDDDETAPGSGHWIGRGTSNLPGRFILTETGVPGRMVLGSGEHGLWCTADIGDWPNKDAVAVKQLEGQVNDTKTNHSAHSVSTAAVHPNDPNTMYILMWRQEHSGTLRRTIDGGKTWEDISIIHKGKTDRVPHQASLLIDPENTNNMYFCVTRKVIQEVGSSSATNLAEGEFGVYRSNDAGYTWSTSNEGLPKGCSVHRLTMNPTKSNIIYASLNHGGKNADGGLYKSTNGAQSWERVKTLSVKAVNDVFINKKNGQMLASCGSKAGELDSGGIFSSMDNGKTWNKIFKARYVLHAKSSTVEPSIVIATLPAQNGNMKDPFMNPGVYLSENAGETWEKINMGLGQPNKIVEVECDPIDANILWCSAWGSGWFKGIIK